MCMRVQQLESRFRPHRYSFNYLIIALNAYKFNAVGNELTNRRSFKRYDIRLQLDVNTVAAGGGSMLFFRSGLFEVGPESAGAHPGPACYKKNGPLAVTDANLALGRLLPEYFPKIFGPNEDELLDKSRTMEAFQELTDEVCERLPFFKN